jgi:hypothetical protein
MTWTNVSIRDDASRRLADALIKAERDFWADEASRLQRELENIPRAVREFGRVDIYDDRDTITLVAKPAAEAGQDADAGERDG